MTAGEAAELVASFIDLEYPSRKSQVFKILRLALNHAWDEGKWWGMSAEIFVRVHHGEQRYFLSPPGYDTLLAVNVDGKPKPLRNKQFMFHKNGNGDVKDSDGCHWNQSVYDIGEIPNLHEINIYFPEGVLIGVRSLGTPGEGEYVSIQGEENGDKVFTYEKTTAQSACSCLTVDSPEDVRTMSGLKIPITKEFNYISNVNFTSITSIHKTPTRCPIEVSIITRDNSVLPTAIMQPWDRTSIYRKYLVPDGCSDVVHAMFKVAKQPTIMDESQTILLSSEEALIALCKGIHLTYHKENLAVGTQYLQQGINRLELENREKNSPDVFPMQVDGPSVGDMPDILLF